DGLLIRRADATARLRRAGIATDAIRSALAGVAAAARDRACELVVAGRASAAGLRWLERSTASRTRALIEERGFRTRTPDQRPVTRPGRCRRPGAVGQDPRRDPARRADHLRSIHGDRALRPGARLLPVEGRATRPRRRLSDRAGGASDLRPRDRAVRPGGPRRDRLAGAAHDPRV